MCADQVLQLWFLEYLSSGAARAVAVRVDVDVNSPCGMACVRVPSVPSSSPDICAKDRVST